MSGFESFRAARWARTLNLVVQAILFLTLFGGLNYLANNHGGWDDLGRLDLTRYHRYSLSPETAAYLRSLAAPVRIVVTQDPDNADPEVRGLLREYEFTTEANPDGKISIEYLDVDLRRREAQRLGIETPNVVALISGDKAPLILPITDLYQYREGQKETFAGEAAITAAILNVSSTVGKKIYFLLGHSEMNPDDPDPGHGLSVARDNLSQRNLEVGTLNLSSRRQIPEDASLLIAVAPQSPFSASEQELLRQYLGAREGRLILFLGPGRQIGLDQLFLDWGVTVDDDLVRDSGADNLTEDEDLIVQEFSPHPVTQALLSSFKPRLKFGPARSVHPDQARAAGNGLDVVTLAATSTTAWGEVNPRILAGGRPFAPGIDLRPLPGAEPPNRLGLAVASERAAARDNLPFSVRDGRLIVVGTGDLISNSRVANEGVLVFLLGAVNWMVDRDRQLNIPARPIDRFQLSLTPRELQDLHYSLMLLLPGAAAVLGLIVYWTRRS
jgi:hypothetical protein